MIFFSRSLSSSPAKVSLFTDYCLDAYLFSGKVELLAWISLNILVVTSSGGFGLVELVPAFDVEPPPV